MERVAVQISHMKNPGPNMAAGGSVVPAKGEIEQNANSSDLQDGTSPIKETSRGSEKLQNN